MPLDPGDGEILGYRVDRGPDLASMVHLADLGNWTGYCDYDISRGTPYCYEVQAFNAVGNGTWSDPVSIIPYFLPSAPTIVSVTVGNGTVHLEWLPPEDDGGRPVTGYRLYRGPSMYPLDPVANLSNVTSYDDTGLEGATVYYAVSALTLVGEGHMSMPVSALPLGPPGPMGSWGAHIGDGYVEISWGPCPNDGGSPILGYMLRKGRSSRHLNTEIDVGLNLSYNDTDVVNGVDYDYTLEAYTALGHGPASERPMDVKPHGPPTAPEALALEVGDGSILVEWTRPNNTGGTDMLGYRVYRGNASDGLALLAQVGVSNISYIDSPVENGHVYWYTVSAVARAGEGHQADPVSGTPYGVPGSPTAFEGNASDRQVVLSWASPAFNGGRPVLAYNVYSGLAADNLSMVASLYNTTTFTESGLENGTEYFYAVTAVNARGEGALTEVLGLTPEAPPPPIEAPREPRGMKCEVEGTDIHINWTPPDADPLRPVVTYTVLRGETLYDIVTVVYTGPSLNFTDSGLQPGRTYYYIVVANNSAGRGAMSEVFSISIPKAKEEPGYGAALTICALAVLVVATGRRDRRRR
jgi:titin